MNLFDLHTQYERTLAAAIDFDTGEVLDEDAFMASEVAEVDFHEKIIAYGIMITNLETQALAVGEVEERLRDRRRALANRAASLRANLALVLKPGDKHADPRVSVSARPGAISVEIPDPALVPDPLCTIVRQPDKLAIRALLDRKEDVPGASLVRGPTIVSIR